MGDVIVRGSFKRSPKFDKLNWFEEALAIRLMTLADDDGMVDGRPLVVKNMAYPTKTSINTKAVDSAMSKLVKVGILSPASDENNSIPYLKFSEEFFEPKPKRDNNNIINTNNNSVLRYNVSLEEQHVSNDREHNSNLERNTERGNTTIPERNPYGTNDGVSTNIADMRTRMTREDTVQAYVTNNLSYMSPGQLQVLQTYIDEMPEELIRLAVDKACDGGFSRRTWRYTKAILDNWLDEGYKTVADVLAADEARRAKKKAKKTDDYSDPDDLSWW